MKPFFDRVREAFRLSPEERRLTAFVLILKAALLIFGIIAHDIYQNRPMSWPLGFLHVWNRWDGPKYLFIAGHGYDATGELTRYNIVFFPGYPLLTAAGMQMGLPAVVSGYLVSSIMSLFVAVLLYRLARLDDTPATAHRAVWFQFIFPTAYFLHSILTESTFLAFTLGAFLAARKQRWSLAGILGLMATMTRMNGLLLIPALMLEAFSEWRATRRLNPDWIFMLGPVLGVLLYLRLNYAVYGDAFQFLTLQRHHWNHPAAFPWQGVYNSFMFSTYAETNSAQMTGTQEFIFALLGFVASIVCAIKMRPSYGVWMIGNWILITSMSFMTSTPRYLLLFFPMFILLGQITKRRLWFDILTICSLLFYGLFAALYAVGRWAF